MAVRTQSKILGILRKYARNELRFAKLNLIDLTDIIQSIDAMFTKQQQNRLSIEGKTLGELRGELRNEIDYRSDTFRTEQDSKIKAKLIHRRLKDEDTDQTKKLLGIATDVTAEIINKRILGQSDKKTEDWKKKTKAKDRKLVDDIRSTPKNPIKAIQRLGNKAFTGHMTNKKKAFSDYSKNNAKKILTKKEFLIYNNWLAQGSKEYKAAKKKVEEQFKKDTGIV